VVVRRDLPFGTDAEFREDLTRSEVAAREVALILLLAGLDVRKPPLAIRPDQSQAAQFSDGGVDLYVGHHRIQVKERTGYRFSGPWDFAFESIIFDTSWGFAKMEHKPAAYVLYSRPCAGLIVVPSSAYRHAITITRTDGRNGSEREFVACPMQHAWSAEQFIETALRKPGCKRLTLEDLGHEDGR
jgi:hypothetical protein